MGRIHQMQMSFAPAEDRILFRVNVTGRTTAEFRFWVTRRFARLFWKALLKMLKSRQPKEVIEKLPDAPAQAGAMEIQHKKAVAKADFQSEFQESHVFPLGDTPILLSRVAVRERAERGQMLCLYPQKGQGLEFASDDKMLHSLCKLLAMTASKAGWDLKLDFREAQKLLEESGGLN